MRPSRTLLGLAATLACVGCGHVATASSDGTLQIGLNEYRITPQDVRAASGTLTITVRNYGRLTHDLVISQDGRADASTQPIAPGQATELVVALAPGQYLMASTILADQALGAYGSLQIR
ncbi:MAG: cupredoxin domain-containing protein [Solirubrobacterales bacterium]|nr:cupredoxin domain-containing protein [Solirubrobacterales bacterium]